MGAADPKIPASDFDIIFATTIGRDEWNLILRDTGASVTGMGMHFRSIESQFRFNK
jgi:hypothetical protein